MHLLRDATDDANTPRLHPSYSNTFMIYDTTKRSEHREVNLVKRSY